jgi:C-terminal processing protease CtpA/Prc
MRAHDGQLVPLFDSLDAVHDDPRDSVVKGPRRVGILVDGGTVSAAEVLVLRGLKSTRVTVFGEPTEGALDYQSTYIVPLSPRERRWYLGYPTITASDKLPAEGMRGKGIQPDVRLNLAHIADPIREVSDALRNR